MGLVYRLRCDAVERQDTRCVRTHFARTFREYGLPSRIRADNGPPFASPGIDRGIVKAKLKELATLAFFTGKENLLLFGKTGEGKPHLAVALGRRLCAEGISTTFVPVNLLFEEIAAAKAAGKYLQLLQQLNRAKVLILDDFGLRSYTHEEATALVDLLD